MGTRHLGFSKGSSIMRTQTPWARTWTCPAGVKHPEAEGRTQE